MQLQSKCELILTFNKAVILNQEISIFSNGSHLKCREETNVKVVALLGSAIASFYIYQ